jgi:hypothetical protein
MKQGCAILILVLLAVLILGRCSRNSDSSAVAPESLQLSPSQPDTAEGEPFDVDSDPRAHYRLLKWSPLKSGHIEAITRRDGPSGTSFTRLEIDCENRLFKVPGEGDTRDDAMRDSPNPGDWADLVPGSIKDVTVSLVCRRVGK